MRADLRWAQVDTKKGQIPADFRVGERSDGRAMRADLRPAQVTTTLGTESAEFGPFRAMVCARRKFRSA